MTKLNGYRLSAAVFALLFAAMVVRELGGSDPVVTPDRTAPAEGTSSSAPVASRESDSSSGARDPSAEPDFASATGSALDLAMGQLIRGRGRGVNWSAVLPKLRPRREEIIPILEDWLRRREELARQGVDLRNVPRAYAELAGAEAVPLLEELLSDPGRRWSHATNEALTRIDDPAAVDLIRRYQESLPQNHCDLNFHWLWRGAPAARELLKDWAGNPPANAPNRGSVCRSIWFQKGTMEEREAVWSLMDDLEKLNVLGGGHARHWGGPWPERYGALIATGLRSTDPRVRCRAILNVIADADASSPELLAEAEAALDHEIPAAEERTVSEGPTRRSLLSMKRSLDSWKEMRAAEQRQRELLSPR